VRSYGQLASGFITGIVVPIDGGFSAFRRWGMVTGQGFTGPSLTDAEVRGSCARRSIAPLDGKRVLVLIRWDAARPCR
jgi:hypothetical protein